MEHIPTNNIILFESKPCLSDNAKPIFDEFLRRGYHKRYKMVWLLDEETEVKQLPHIKGVQYIKKSQPIIYHCILYRAKCIVCCNEPIATTNPAQISIYISHGSPIKQVKGYYMLPDAIDFVINQCEEFNAIAADQLHFPLQRCFALGYPRTDALMGEKRNVSSFFSKERQKVIAWYPTFRQHKKVEGLTGCEYAIPILHSDEDAEILNAYARELQVILVLKIHFAQDMKWISRTERSNLVIVDDSFFTRNHISSYEFLGSCDGLISDYSSVYYDFTLVDKPIGLIWEDIKEYKENPGFSVDLENYMSGAVKIYNMKQLRQFISDVAEGKDPLREKRNQIKRIVDVWQDGCATQRVTDFVIEHAGL